MVADVLAVLMAVLIFVLGISWSIRLIYVSEFRTADVNIFTYTVQADVSDSEEQVQAYKAIAREWFRASEDYRAFSVTLSYLTTWLLMGTALICLALIAAYLEKFNVCWALIIPGIILLALGVLVILPRFGYIQTIPWIEQLSKGICDRIPILDTSDLNRWTEIQSVIDKHEWLNESPKQLFIDKPHS